MPACLSVDPMTQIAIYQQEQTALIQTMAQDLNGSFTDRMEGIITSAAAPIQKSLQEFVEVNTQQQLRLIDKVAGRFVERMDSMLDGQFRNLSRVIDDTCASQKKASELVGQSMNEAGRVLKNAAQLQSGLEDDGRPARRRAQEVQRRPRRRGRQLPAHRLQCGEDGAGRHPAERLPKERLRHARGAQPRHAGSAAGAEEPFAALRARSAARAPRAF